MMEEDNMLNREQVLEKYQHGQRLFEDIQLDNVDLHGEDLKEIHFNRCHVWADFRNCNLTNAKFTNGSIKGSDFRNANLTNLLIERVSVESTYYGGADCTGLVFKDNSCYASFLSLGQDAFESQFKNTPFGL